MADYIIQLSINTNPDVDAGELQATLNDPDVKKHLGDVLSRCLVLPAVSGRKEYPKAGTIAVGSVTVKGK
jgi:hypothetical protein